METLSEPETPRKVSRRNLRILFRYLTEILIIFIGITISFAFEQWREDERQKDALVEITKSLLNDTKTARQELLQDQPESGMWIARTDSIRVFGTQKKLSAQQLDWFYSLGTGQFTFLFEAGSPTFKSVSSTSQWNEFPDTIRTKIYRVYNNKLQYAALLYNQQMENITHFRLRLLESESSFASANPDYTALSAMIAQENWQNLANQVWITERKCHIQNEAAIKAMQELEKDLEEYLRQLQKS